MVKRKLEEMRFEGAGEEDTLDPLMDEQPDRVPRPRVQPRYRITIVGEDLELRGYIDGTTNLHEVGKRIGHFGSILASLAPDDFNPFRERS